MSAKKKEASRLNRHPRCVVHAPQSTTSQTWPENQLNSSLGGLPMRTPGAVAKHPMRYT